jgi:hypothetical protein
MKALLQIFTHTHTQTYAHAFPNTELNTLHRPWVVPFERQSLPVLSPETHRPKLGLFLLTRPPSISIVAKYTEKGGREEEGYKK